MYDMYDDDYSNESDYSFEYSDYEYNSLEPYHTTFEASNVPIEETPEEKLLKYIQFKDIAEIKSLMPSLMKLKEKSAIFNGDDKDNINISENGDIGSDISEDESDNEVECKVSSDSQYQEIILKNGDTPLMTAASEGDFELVEYFLSLGCNVNYKLPNSNKTALLALFCKSDSFTFNDQKNKDKTCDLIKCLQLILNAGGDIKAKSFMSTQEYGNTALHYAAQGNCWEIMSILIHAGADVDAMNNQKLTPLHIAASKGYVSCCNALLLAGANAKLVDKSGNTAADMAEHEKYNHLSDAINIYCGNAQSNVRLYQTWRQYSITCQHTDHESNFSDFGENINHNHSSIESFCLALDAPYLSKLMDDQGISITDLKFMDEKKLCELGVPESDCKNLVIAMKDLNKKTKSESKKVDFSYGRPLKPITILEMLGNIGEHIELIETNLESTLCHLNRNEKFYLEKYRTINKSTVDNLKLQGQRCMDVTFGLIEKSNKLKTIVNRQINEDYSNFDVDTDHSNYLEAINEKKISKNYSIRNRTILVVSILSVSLGVAVALKRFI